MAAGDDRLAFDHHGRQIKFLYELETKSFDSYPKRILKKHESNVRATQTVLDDAIGDLKVLLKKPLESGVRDLQEEFVLHDALEVHVPIFEARLIGPKQKVGIMRVDAARIKIL